MPYHNPTPRQTTHRPMLDQRRRGLLVAFTRGCVLFLLSTLALWTTPAVAQATFTRPAGDRGLNNTTGKNGGMAWGDFDNDGCLDVLVNTTTNTQVYQGTCSGASPSYAVFFTTSAGTRERSAVWGDYDNDGDLDFAHNTHDNLDLYTFNGSTFIQTVLTGKLGAPNLNTEGLGWFDFNADGYLDLFVENHEYGIDILQGDGTAAGFTQVNATTAGLPTGATSGDYAAVADYDRDGDVDVLARKEGTDNAQANQIDLWTNDGDATFTANTNSTDANLSALNTNKGGAAFCDFNNDGYFDLFWTDNGGNRLLLQDGAGGGTFTFAASEPAPSIGSFTDIDGVTCGDVDNDGDLDLFLTDSDDDFLFINQFADTGSLTWVQNNGGITGSNDGEQAVLVDHDEDGDVDLYINSDTSNELWENQLSNGNGYLVVEAQYDAVSATTGTASRLARGASAVLETCDGTLISGAREINGGSGHGGQEMPMMHFGLGSRDLTHPLVVSVLFVGGTLVKRAITPGTLPGSYRILTVTDTDGDKLDLCTDTDNDTLPDAIDLDDDNDGLPDTTESGVEPSDDDDGDGTPNYKDADYPGFIDTDSDGVNDNFDSDLDGVPDHLDLDADADGIPDVVEAGGSDSNGDGVIDTMNDVDDDGLPDSVDIDQTLGTDTDSDGIDDTADVDQTLGTDTDNDGIDDNFDPDADGDGLADEVDPSEGGTPLSNPDSDSDGLKDYLDIDADADGIPDNVEAQSSAGFTKPSGTDTDSDGLDDNYDPDNGGTSLSSPYDHDVDLTPDYLDTDSDDDGALDTDEAYPATTPASTDSDNDGLDDNYEDVGGYTPGDLDNPNNDIADTSADLPNNGGGDDPDFRNSGILPVELTSFDVLLDGSDALLRWTTASETNNAGFEIQHTAGVEPLHAMALPWTVLDFVEGHGTTEFAQAYSYRVENLAPGRHVFRLKQIDFDGTLEYHPEAEIVVAMAERFVIEPAFPNPFNPQTQFRFAVQRVQSVRVELYDMLGRQVKVLYEGEAPAGQMQVVRIDGTDLPSGLYVVRVAGTSFVKAQTVTLLK